MLSRLVTVFVPALAKFPVLVLAVFGLCVMAPATAQAQSIVWTLRNVAPSQRNAHAMAYDSARGVTVLFGGVTNTGYSGETWEWNGTIWTQRFVTGPSPRYYHAMAYDAARGVTVLFGGSTNSGNSGETWEWNGTSWTQRVVSGPSPRNHHAMAYDSARGVTVLFGGSTSSGNSAETWEWNGTTWTQRVVGGLPARFAHAMAYDAARGVTVLFGGFAPNLNSETWEWNGTVWTQRVVSAPSPREDCEMVYDSARAVTMIFAGNGGNGDTWEWNGTVWTQRVVSGPSQRSEHAMAYDSARGVAVLFGGNGGNGDTWEWNGTAWAQRVISGPSPRLNHAMAYDSARAVTVLFSGWNGATFNSETWEWNGTVWTLRTTSGPSARYYSAMAYDSARGVTVLFAGAYYDGAYHYNDETWEWNGIVWTQRMVSGPSPRAAFAMAYDSARGVTVLFGGTNAVTGVTNGETWEWNGTSWTQRAGGPFQRYSHAMAYDSARGVTVMFGGNNGAATDETWEWNGTAWTNRTHAPTARSLPAMVYDTARGVMVVFGGSDNAGTRLGDTWEWNGTGAGTWTQRIISGPSARDQHAMAYDSSRGKVVLFGGCCGANGETWELGVPCAVAPSITVQPGAQTVCASGSASFAVATTSSGATTYQWRRNTVPLSNAAGHIAGVDTFTLSITNAMGSDAGSYDCVVTNPCGNATSNAASLTVNSAPLISQPPGPATTCTSFPATFSVTVTGTSPFTLQWQIFRPGVPGVWVNIVNGANSVAGLPPFDASGAMTFSLSVTETNGAGDSATSVRCIVTNSCGSATSDSASLVVVSPTTGACCHGTACSMTSPGACSGTFLGAGEVCSPKGRNGFMNACCPADFNNSGTANVQDIFDFLAAWFAGCP